MVVAVVAAAGFVVRIAPAVIVARLANGGALAVGADAVLIRTANAIGQRVKSSATTRPLSIPKGGVTMLELDLFKATRSARNWDAVSARA